MKRYVPFLTALILVAAPLQARSRFAFYFNSSKTRITTIIIYNESTLPLSLDVNGEIGGKNDVSSSESAGLLIPGDLISFRRNFQTGDCIMVESESDELSLAMTNDRDSVYIYAREGRDNGHIHREN